MEEDEQYKHSRQLQVVCADYGWGPESPNTINQMFVKIVNCTKKTIFILVIDNCPK